jgi:triosephosphate isomerase (TIM)
MSTENRQKIIVANWKMYKTIGETAEFIKELIQELSEQSPSVYLAVPFTAIKTASDLAEGNDIVIGAQNMNDASEGAFTGEIAGRMLKDAGAKFVILGHSERRQIYKESNAFINRKVKRAIKDDLQAILCVGETLEEREEGTTQEILNKQITECLEGVDVSELNKIILAYEPIWAIGTGKTATPEMAEEAHQFCRQSLKNISNKETADSISILYGGSVKPDNAKGLMEQPDIDGLLVGGASLSLDSFFKIVNDSGSESKK